MPRCPGVKENWVQASAEADVNIGSYGVICLNTVDIWLNMIYKYGSVSKPCTPVVHIKIAGKWMFIPLKMVLIGIDPYPYTNMNMFTMLYTWKKQNNYPCFEVVYPENWKLIIQKNMFPGIHIYNYIIYLHIHTCVRTYLHDITLHCIALHYIA